MMPSGGLAQEWILRGLISVEIIFSSSSELSYDIFPKVRDEPAFVHGVAMEAAGELVVDAAAGHFFKGGFSHGEGGAFLCLLVALENQDSTAEECGNSGRARSRHA